MDSGMVLYNLIEH